MALAVRHSHSWGIVDLPFARNSDRTRQFPGATTSVSTVRLCLKAIARPTIVSRSREPSISNGSTPKPCRVRAVLMEHELKSVERRSIADEAVEKAVVKKLEMGHVDTYLESTNTHRAWVASGVAALLALAGKGAIVVHDLNSMLAFGIGIITAYLLADLGTGIYHWGVDNYGDAATPVFGPQIDAFQGHHKRPWTITKRKFANNLQALAKPTLFVLIPFLALPSDPLLDGFMSSFMACVMFSQQFHSWAHTPKVKLPRAVVALQDAGLLVPRKMHGAHHRPPFNGNYCIVSGICNEPLDRSGFLPWLETSILRVWGVAPRCWGETAPEWLADGGAYFEDGSGVDIEL